MPQQRRITSKKKMQRPTFEPTPIGWFYAVATPYFGAIMLYTRKGNSNSSAAIRKMDKTDKTKGQDRQTALQNNAFPTGWKPYLFPPGKIKSAISSAFLPSFSHFSPAKRQGAANLLIAKTDNSGHQRNTASIRCLHVDVLRIQLRRIDQPHELASNKPTKFGTVEYIDQRKLCRKQHLQNALTKISNKLTKSDYQSSLVQNLSQSLSSIVTRKLISIINTTYYG